MEIDLVSCKHKSLCEHCFPKFFVAKQCTKCPRCNQLVGENISFSQGIIKMRQGIEFKQDEICILCNKPTEMGTILIPCKFFDGCECKICDICIIDYDIETCDKLCLCAEVSRSGTPYVPPYNVVKSIKNLENNKKSEHNENSQNIRNLKDIENPENNGNVENLEKGGFLRNVEFLENKENNESLENIEDFEETESLSDDVENVENNGNDENSEEVEFLRDIEFLENKENDEGLENIEDSEDAETVSEDIENVEHNGNGDDLGKNDFLRDIDVGILENKENIQNLESNEDLEQTESLSDILNNIVENYKADSENYGGVIYDDGDSKEEDPTIVDQKPNSKQRSISFDEETAIVISKTMLYSNSKESSIVFDDKSRLQSLQSDADLVFVDPNKTEWFYQLSKSSQSNSKTEIDVIEGEEHGTPCILESFKVKRIFSNRKKRAASPTSRFSTNKLETSVSNKRRRLNRNR